MPKSDQPMIEPVAAREMTREEFGIKDAIVQRGIQVFEDVGLALWEIRERRGYRFSFGTWENYCQQRLNWTHGRADQLIRASKLVLDTRVSIPTEGHARELLKLSAPEVVKLVGEIDLDKTSVRKLAQIVKAKRVEAIKESRAERIAEIVEGNQSLSPELGTFNLLYADPPWRYDYSPTESRAIENQYPTMPLDEICALPVEKIAAGDCALFLWATNPKLEDALTVVRAWGFTYKTNMVWVKDKIGMGYYARQQHELLLIATKGELPVPEPSVRPASVICGEREEHSAKPASVYAMLERMYPDFPKVELFSRSPREGWGVWGNQSQ